MTLPETPKTLGVIPARWGSTRFPGKPLHSIAGKSLIQRVWERCLECQKLDKIIVATDDTRISEAVTAFGGHAIMTRSDHPSGTDRIAEVSEKLPSYKIILNIQGDEPLIDPELIDQLGDSLLKNPDLPMVTAANPISTTDPAVNDPNIVKVVKDVNGLALYFSRSAIPFLRNSKIPGLTLFRHKGIYGFQRDFLQQFVQWNPSPLEQTEGLEQLRAMENGGRILVIETNDQSPGIDTIEQADILERELLGF